jgi:hypothetical protein
MLHVALKPTDRYGVYSLNDYQFVSQGIFLFTASSTYLLLHHYIHMLTTAH